MGYSNSLKTLEGFYPYISHLENGQGYAWITEEGAAPKLAYKIRECLYIAKLHPQAYPKLAAVAGNLVIETVSATRVQARVDTSKPTEATILSGEAVSPTHGLTDGHLGRALATAGEQTAFTIIDVWRKQQPNNTPIVFPQAKLDYQSLVALWNWAQNWKPRLMLMVDGDSVTVGPVEEEVEQYAFHPKEEDLPVIQHEPPKSFPVPPSKY